MRIALTLGDGIVQITKDYAAVRGLNFDKATSELVRMGIRARLPVLMINGLAVVDLPPDSPVITTERVREIMEDDF